MTRIVSLFNPDKNGVRVFQTIDSAEPNFSIVATHVRHGQSSSNYRLVDAEKLEEVIEKWQFVPKSEPLSRCGYDYQVVATNGDTTLNLSICFVCKTLVLNHRDQFAISPRQILKLFAEDFRVVS